MTNNEDAAPHGPDFVAADGSIQVTRADYPGAGVDGAWHPAPDTLTCDDILGVRAITRVDPPFDEAWVVVTLAVRNRWGDDVRQIARLNLNGRTFAVSPPAELAAAEVVAQHVSPEAPSAAPATAVASSEGEDARDGADGEPGEERA